MLRKYSYSITNHFTVIYKNALGLFQHTVDVISSPREPHLSLQRWWALTPKLLPVTRGSFKKFGFTSNNCRVLLLFIFFLFNVKNVRC